MNSKLTLILFGALIALAVISATENMEENSLSEEVASSRLARAADADPGKKKKNKSKKKNKKASRKNKSKRKNKKASKKNKSKRKNKKASKKNKSKRKNKKASKKNKSKKQNKKASKKNKSERKNKKANKKNKSKRKNKKSRKNKKNKKTSDKRTIKEGRSTVPDTCVATAVNALYNGLSKKASNFDRQLKRIEARLPKIESKRGKMSEYNQTMDDLIAANASCPAGDKIIIDALIATLGECEAQISTACATPVIDTAQIDACKPIVEGFVAEVEKCFGLNSDPVAACGCWESDALAELEAGLKDCIIKPSESNVTEGFKACKAAVSSCNKAQAEAIPVLVNCSKSTTDLVAEAETVANNIAALEGAKAAVEAVTSTTRAAATNCTELIALVDALLALTPEDSGLADVAEDIVESSGVTCTAEEKLTLTSAVVSLDALIVEAEAALEAIQAAILEETGSTAAIETTPLVAVTTVASRMRGRGFMRQLNFKM